MGNTTHEQRQGMIVQWKEMKKSKQGRDQFLQVVYSLTLSRDQYLDIEYRLVMDENGVKKNLHDKIMTNFFASQSERGLDRHAEIWKKYHSSKRLRKSRAKWLQRTYS